MLTQLRERRRESWFRPAPPAVYSNSRARADHPPDGWMPVGTSMSERLYMQVDGFLIRVSALAARGVSRRQFLRRVGEVGVVAAAAASGVLPTRWSKAGHAPVGERKACRGTCSPCGPSPLCNLDYCNDDSPKNCATGRPDTKRRRYEHFDCVGPTVANFWFEECCFDSACNGTWKDALIQCSDCCGGAGGTSCSSGSCPNGSKACICRGVANPSC